MENQITAEQIAQHYSAAMDSVNLINAGQPEGMSDEDWADCVSRNVEHLKIMVAKDFWTDEDLTPFIASVIANYTDTPKDDVWVAKAYKVLEMFAFLNNKAKQK
jgi:hypothetical protein